MTTTLEPLLRSELAARAATYRPDPRLADAAIAAGTRRRHTHWLGASLTAAVLAAGVAVPVTLADQGGDRLSTTVASSALPAAAWQLWSGTRTYGPLPTATQKTVTAGMETICQHFLATAQDDPPLELGGCFPRLQVTVDLPDRTIVSLDTFGEVAYSEENAGLQVEGSGGAGGGGFTDYGTGSWVAIDTPSCPASATATTGAGLSAQQVADSAPVSCEGPDTSWLVIVGEPGTTAIQWRPVSAAGANAPWTSLPVSHGIAVVNVGRQATDVTRYVGEPNPIGMKAQYRLFNATGEYGQGSTEGIVGLLPPRN